MHKILERLYVGDLEDGRTATAPITLIMNVSQYSYETPPPLVQYHRSMVDEVFHDARYWQQLVMELYGLHARTDDTVLVHCRLGKSRSPALVAAYLAYCGYARDVDHAFTEVLKKHPETFPHTETWRGVRAWWAQSRGIKDVA